MKLVLCLAITLLLVFSYINAESTCLSISDWNEKFSYGTIVEGEDCGVNNCGYGLHACDITGNGKKLSCDCYGPAFKASGGHWIKTSGSCTQDANGDWCT
ncbi:unnamed protein product [Cunninghamella echinulata]